MPKPIPRQSIPSSDNSWDLSTWAIENTCSAQKRLITELFQRANPKTRLSTQGIAVQLILLGNDRSGCLDLTIDEVVEATGASRTTVEQTLREMIRLKLLRREGMANRTPTFRWLTPIADRVVSNDAPRRHKRSFWRSVEVLASTMVEQQTGENEPKQAETEQQPPALGEPKQAETEQQPPALDAATIFAALTELDAKELWIETHKQWRLKTFGLRSKDRPMKSWESLLDFVGGFQPHEQEQAVKLALRLWPEVASQKVKDNQYPLSWLEYDIAPVERRVRQALAQREQERAEQQASPPAGTPPKLTITTWNGQRPPPRKVAAA